MAQPSVWDDRFMELARHVGGWSKDRSTKVGCIIVGQDRLIRAIGFNGFPRGIDDDIEDRHARPNKYDWTEHAERNAIYNAARIGISLNGCTMYLPWFPCVDCARAIVQAGLTELVALEPDIANAQWGRQFTVSLDLLKESSVALRWHPSTPPVHVPENTL
jgi:dCMP deaminase